MTKINSNCFIKRKNFDFQIRKFKLLIKRFLKVGDSRFLKGYYIN